MSHKLKKPRPEYPVSALSLVPADLLEAAHVLEFDSLGLMNHLRDEED
jgi:hypothetical protein